MGPSYAPGSKDDLFFKTITMPVLMMGKNVESVSEIPAGNTCAIIGIDNCLVKTGTIATHPDSYPIKSMSYSVSPVVRVAVSAKHPSDIMKLINGL
jgi:elongation factor 2